MARTYGVAGARAAAGGADLRSWPLSERRKRLQAIWPAKSPIVSEALSHHRPRLRTVRINVFEPPGGDRRSLDRCAILVLIATRDYAPADIALSDAQMLQIAPFTAHEAQETIVQLLPGRIRS